MKKSVLFLLILSFLVVPIFSGCSSGAVNYYLTSFPNKLVYEIGETPNYEGLKVETTNTDGTHSTVRLRDEDISNVDTSTSGVKKVFIRKNGLSTAFNIYVADIVITDSDNLKQKLSTAKDGDIIYLKAGNYLPKNNGDLSYKDVIVDKQLTIVGDGKKNTNFSGNFIVGATSDNENFTAIENFENVIFINVGFKLNSTVQDGFKNYSGPYGKTDYNGAIRAFNTKNLSVINCSFENYAYGIFGDDLQGLTVKNCSFRWIDKNAIKTTKNTRNATINKNIFMDIASNMISADGNTQSSLGPIELSFGSKGNVGVIIASNTFTRIGLLTGDAIYYDEKSKSFAESTREQLTKMSYINNTAIITLISSAEDDLEVEGIILSSNNYGQTAVNLRLNTTPENNIDQNGVMINEAG